MPIVAMCPYCRAGGVRAPESAIGQSATCPSCKSNFTVVPSDDPAAKAAANPAPPPPAPVWSIERAPDKPAPPRPAVEETREHSSPVDVTEPSPVLPAERPDPAPRPLIPSYALPVPALDTGYAFALGAATLFGVGMLAAQVLPFGRAVGLGVCGVGAVGGLLCLGAEGRTRLVAAAAAVLNLAAVLLLLFAPTWLALDPWRGGEADAPTGPVAVGHGTRLTAPADWVEADRASWGYRDVLVTVRSAALGPLDPAGPKDPKRKAREQYLHLTLRVANEGVERRVGLSGWAAGSPDGVRLTDPAGKALAAKPGPAGPDAARPAGLFPGKRAEVTFVFEAPAGRPEYLRLELPGAAVGVAEPVRFRIPGSFLTVRRG
ncbi:MAG: hypothetical protein K2X87_05355 [Gemmataceae bacterium]|nr:hypothetical protein [Gemmataceae bacterium]